MNKSAARSNTLQPAMTRVELLEHYRRGATLLSGAQLNVGHSYGSLKFGYRAITNSAEKCVRARALIKEVDSELKNYRLTGRFVADPKHLYSKR